jgi:L-lactate dehydrogenase complex protein LldG
MSDARAAILSRVRQAQRTGRIPATGAAGPTVVAQPSVAGRDTSLTRFLDELTGLGVTWHIENSAEAVRGRIAAIVGDRSVLSWDANRLPYDVGQVLRSAVTAASPRDVQAQAEIGVTGCDAAIAETGTLMLLSGDGKPRAASLLPPVHLAIVRRADLRFTMGDCFRERADGIAAAACCTFVTGPSRTADIELTLTLGVHGPGQVIVIVGP